MLADRERLRRRAAQPHLVSFFRALTRLGSPLTMMNTGAHPDDEHNELLALLRHDFGMRIVIACSTRGEGGQNTLGPERGGALGMLRTSELEEAARVLDADIAWLGHGPDDPVHDFGFSKSGPDTLARWGEERTLERLVRAYRRFRPDIVLPTFLDVPGQHGHHRAMTQAAERAIALAADPTAFPEHAAEGLLPWQVSKFYLPAWSGGGGTYDDELPPPPATTRIVAEGPDIATGLSFDRLGEVSRANHACQNMGFWRHPPDTEWQLHLVGGSAEGDIRDGLPRTLSALGSDPALAEADAAIAAARAAFPDTQKVIAALADARSALERTSLSETENTLHGHRLARKRREIDEALAQAAGLDVSAGLSQRQVSPGTGFTLEVEVTPGRATAIAIVPVTEESITASEPAAPDGGLASIALSVTPTAPIANRFAESWESLGGNGPVAVRITAEIEGLPIAITRDTEEALAIVPAHAVSLTPQAIVLRLPAGGAHGVEMRTDAPRDSLTIDGAPGLDLSPTDTGFALTPKPDFAPGRHRLAVRIDGQQAFAVSPIAYPHIGRTQFLRPMALEILALDLAVPTTRIGFVDGGADTVGRWLSRIGADVVSLDAEALSNSLDGFDTIVVGLFAFGTRPDLAAAAPRLRQWVEKGGHLVTLYHRPSDGWSPETTPPRPLTIGSPSLRWRVTDPDAPVTLLAPDHALLAGPNRITAADFAGWDKERGLYFASSWDPAYTPLLAMNDAGEKPLQGSLLSAKIDEGRHTHTSLVLHHQLDKLVPGAFRLVANLLQAG